MVSWLDKAQIGSNRGKSAEFSLRGLGALNLDVFKPSERSREVSDKRFGLFSVDLSRFEAVFKGRNL